MAGQGSSNNHPQTVGNNNTVYNVRVTSPITDSSAAEIRDNILSDFFGYSELDIKTLDEQKKGYFYINDKSTPTKWATGAQIKKWAFNPDGTVRVDMPQKLIDSLTSFREQRTSFEIFKVGTFITDAETRKEVTDALEKILSVSGDKRITALNNLMVTIASSQTSRGEILRAVKFLSNESGYKNNPFLLIAAAAATSYKSETASFSSAEVNQGSIAAAIKATNESLYNSSSKNAVATINRSEAASLNYWASNLYDNVNAGGEARNRRWIERFLNMSDTERNSLKPGDMISIANPTQNSIRPPFVSEKNAQKLDNDFSKTVDMWNQTDQIGKDQSFPLPGDQRQSEYYQNSEDTFEKEGWKVNKQRANQTRPKVEPTLKPNNYNPYSQANIPADGFGAVLYLFLEGQKFNQFDRRMRVVTDYLNKKRQMENQVMVDNYRSIPPPPQVIEKYIKEFRRDGKITLDVFQKVKIVGILSELERLLEESNAVYKSKK